jgi:hypothetical protein
VAGTFEYSPPLGTVLPAGAAQTLHFSFTPADTTDYTAASAGVVLNVDPAPLTIVASGALIPYGATPPPVIPIYDGFVNGETAASLARAPDCTVGATTASPLGSYATTCGGALDPNYQIGEQAGTLQIISAATVLQVVPVSLAGSQASATVTFSATLTSTSTGAPVTSAPVTFAWQGGAGQCTASTDARGVAVCRVPGLNVAALAPFPVYTADYAGGTDYDGSHGSASLAVP